MKVLDLFSGIGGFGLGLQRAGMETIAFCEIDPYCRRVLQKNFPGVPIFEDIKKLDGKQFNGSIDVICGGAPCQPFSLAGSQRSTEDDRYLWPEMFRVIQEARPNWVICENVSGLKNLALDECIDDLESAGYATQTFNIPACAVGAPHERQRIWIIANAKPERKNTAMADTKSFNDRGSITEKEKRQVQKLRACYRRMRRLWASESGVHRISNGVSHRMERIRGLGNAVVPQIVEIIGLIILEIENNRV